MEKLHHQQTERKVITSFNFTLNSWDHLSYQYPETYGQFLDEQREAHAEGSKFGHDLFERYCPKEAANLLKSNNVWHKPYTFDMKPEMKAVYEQGVPANYKETVLSLFDLEDHVCDMTSDLESDICNDELINECSVSCDESFDICEDDDETDDTETVDDSSESIKKLYTSKLEGEKLSKIHITKALKLLVPCEFISRNRSQRHLSTKYLPGHQAVDPTYDISIFSDVAIKTTLKKRLSFHIAKVASLRSVEGTGKMSVSSKAKSHLIRFLHYVCKESFYRMPCNMGVTSWRSIISIIMAVDLKKDDTGSYKLDCKQENCLRNKGYYPLEDSDDIEDSIDDNVENIAGTSEEVTDNELPEGYYDVESVSGTRINKDRHVLEYKVHFKGYSEEDDRWLPAGAFDQPVDYTSLSSYGCKQKHKCPESSQSRTGKGDSHARSKIKNKEWQINKSCTRNGKNCITQEKENY